MRRKLKWFPGALAHYDAAYQELHSNGFTHMREVEDYENQTLLTFWQRNGSAAIQQTWCETGDVVYWISATLDEVYFGKGGC